VFHASSGTTVEIEETDSEAVRWDMAWNALIKRREYRGGITSSSPYSPIGISFTSMVITPQWQFLVLPGIISVEENNGIPRFLQKVDS